jgi:tetrahydroxynaphthalene reductase
MPLSLDPVRHVISLCARYPPYPKLITCSGRGIGKEMALELARRGANVVVNYANSAEAAEKVVADIKAMGRDAIAVKANVANVSETIEMFAQAKKHFGKLHIVSSNSGVVSFGHMKDVTEEEFDRVFQINTRGQFFVAREAYKNLEVGGSIILMGSITGQAKGVPKHATYSGSKGAIETFTRCFAIDAGDKKITVNCVAPGGLFPLILLLFLLFSFSSPWQPILVTQLQTSNFPP